MKTASTYQKEHSLELNYKNNSENANKSIISHVKRRLHRSLKGTEEEIKKNLTLVQNFTKMLQMYDITLCRMQTHRER